VLAVAAIGIPPLHDRGTPRSSWPLAAYASTLSTTLSAQLCIAAAACGALAGPASALSRFGAHPGPALPRWSAALLPLLGMALAARLESRMPNALWLPRAAVVLALVGNVLGSRPLLALSLGVMFAASPAAVARGAGEMERPVASSLAWSALIAGAALGAVL
jgi:hypothetical protein